MGTYRTIKLGSQAKDVLRLQMALGIDETGKFDRNTEAEVISFQTRYGLKVDGIVGDKTWAKLEAEYKAGRLPPEKVEPESDLSDAKFRKPVDYRQWDKRWKNVPYSVNPGNKSKDGTPQNIGTSGCGATAMADVLALRDSRITPVEVAKWFVDNGFRTKESGTAYGAFPWIAKKFGMREEATTSISLMQKYLRNGGHCVCNMGQGYWTAGGHYICVWKYDNDYFYVCDPNSSEKTKQKKDQFMRELKKAFCFIG